MYVYAYANGVGELSLFFVYLCPGISQRALQTKLCAGDFLKLWQCMLDVRLGQVICLSESVTVYQCLSVSVSVCHCLSMFVSV